MSRIVWISGGVVAVCPSEGSDVEVTMGFMGKPITKIALEDHGKLFLTLRTIGFSIIGATFIRHIDEIRLLRPAKFYAAAPDGSWRIDNVEEKWREIAFAAQETQRFDVMTVAARLMSGFFYSGLRLHDLAEAYAIQLRGVGRWSAIKECQEYQDYSDLNSPRVYKTIHALFWEMAVLRDTLAEFAAKFCFSIRDVTTLSSLAKVLRKSSNDDELSKIFIAMTSPKGWAQFFTEYRNFFTHVTPLHEMDDADFAVQDMRRLASGLEIPQIYYPLPQDIQEARREYLGRFADPAREGLRKAEFRQRERSKEPDALEYLHRCLDDFARLAELLIKRSPIAPKRFCLGDLNTP